jgi:hypothetical protein
MSADTFSDTYEKGKDADFGTPARSKARADARAKWRGEWDKESTHRERGFVCSKCLHFVLDNDNTLSAIFPDLGQCAKFGGHRFGSASCNSGIWNGRRRPDSP